MRIKLHFPPEAIEGIKALGLRQLNPETLRLMTEHPASHCGVGVILRGKTGEILDGQTFRVLHERFGAWIECDSERTKNRVEKSLSTAATGLDDQVKVVAGEAV